MKTIWSFHLDPLKIIGFPLKLSFSSLFVCLIAQFMSHVFWLPLWYLKSTMKNIENRICMSEMDLEW